MQRKNLNASEHGEMSRSVKNGYVLPRLAYSINIQIDELFFLVALKLKKRRADVVRKSIPKSLG